MRVLVLGGYGFIGREIVRRLSGGGCDVVALARSAARGRRLAPEAEWIGADLSNLTTPAAWTDHLSGVDAVVNASGALQSGGRDDLARSQSAAIRALIEACVEGGVGRFVQISAPGANPADEAAFLATKGEADAVLRASPLKWVIFKPGLVIGANAYGGTSLLRMLAGTPWAQALVLADRHIQTVSVDDVADAVARALMDQELGGDFDLVEPEPHSLAEVVAAFRAWLGFPPPHGSIALPVWFGFALARLADVVGWLGWRSPLRTTSLRMLARDVVGDPAPWARVTGRPLTSLEETLADLPATLQERSFARSQLVFPLLVAVLGLFWIVTGVMALVRHEAAAALLSGAVAAPLALGLVVAGALADMAIGVGVLVRPCTRVCALGSVALAALYLGLGTALLPALWADPMGPFVKAVPAMALALAVAALAEPR